jgi:hypothetical protein
MTREERKQYNYNQSHKETDGVIYKKCSKCSEEKAWKPMTEEYFYKWSYGTVDEYHSQCIECQLKYRKELNKKPEQKEAQSKRFKEWYENNKEYMLALNDKWFEENKEKTEAYMRWYRRLYKEKIKEYSQNHRNHDITKSEWDYCLKIFNNSCVYCGISEDEAKEKYNEKLHKDHVDNEGYNDIRNGIPACKGCNDRKLTFDIEEWFKKQKFFSEDKLNKIIWWITEGYKDCIEEKPPYRIIRSRVCNENGTYKYQSELWSVDEKRNLIECIEKFPNKNELKLKYNI